jgi:uncharacterized membrane protein HdeD (DUF308 family)
MVKSTSLEVNAAELADRWWVPTLRGAAAIAFGIVAALAPRLGLIALLALYGSYALLDGAFNLVLAFRTRREGRAWGWFVFAGVAGIGAAIVTFFWPGLTAMALLMVIAAWAILTGGFAVAAAVRLRKQIRGEWSLAASGVLSVIFGVLLISFPAAGALAVVFWIAAYAVVLGCLLLALGLKLRSFKHESEGRSAGPQVTAPV